MLITEENVNDAVKHTQYYRFPGTTVTVCCITMQNNYTVIGTSACADGKEFDENIGCNLAYQDAKKKIWSLLGYILRDKLHQAELKDEVYRSTEG